jgi:glycosyltransferase involved in cell wall biosynthesis
VLVNPSLEDNYPMVPLEAQACGTPVVSSNTCGSPETVTNGIVVNDARSADAYIEAIKKITGGTTV